MKAAYYAGGRKVTIGECKIQAPGPGEVRIEVAYCGVCGTDLHIYMGHMDGRIDMPQVIGHEMSGKIVEVGTPSQIMFSDNPVVKDFVEIGRIIRKTQDTTSGSTR